MSRLNDARRWRGKTGTIYLLHFEQPLKHARHYIGWTDNLDQRLRDHLKGQGSRLVRAVVAAGIGVALARTWKGDLFDERVLHRQRNASRHCPICHGEKDAAANLLALDA